MMFEREILGGVLIGLASALPLLFDGRVAGISGYASSTLNPKTNEGKSGALLVIGLVIGGFLWRLSGNALSTFEPSSAPLGTWAIAGLLVGFGSRLAGGCTSGHGVCGLGRAAPRSFASVLIFMGVAMLVTFLRRTYL